MSQGARGGHVQRPLLGFLVQSVVLGESPYANGGTQSVGAVEERPLLGRHASGSREGHHHKAKQSHAPPGPGAPLASRGTFD